MQRYLNLWSTTAYTVMQKLKFPYRKSINHKIILNVSQNYFDKNLEAFKTLEMTKSCVQNVSFYFQVLFWLDLH